MSRLYKSLFHRRTDLSGPCYNGRVPHDVLCRVDGNTVDFSFDGQRLEVLDRNGYRSKMIGLAKSITLLPTTLYYLIEK